MTTTLAANSRLGAVALYVWNSMWRNLQRHKVIVSGGKVNWLIDGRCGERLPAIDLAHVDLARGEQRQNNMAAVSAEGSTVRVLTRRLNSSCSRSIAFVEETGGSAKRAKTKSRTLCVDRWRTRWSVLSARGSSLHREGSNPSPSLRLTR